MDEALATLKRETIDGIVASLVVNYLRESKLHELASKLEDTKACALVSLRGIKLQHLFYQYYSKSKCDGCHQKLDFVVNGPFYTQLGFAPSLNALRLKMSIQFNAHKLDEIRFVEAFYTKEPKLSEAGCPVANLIQQRSCPAEKVLVIVKKRNGHSCHYSWIVIAIVVWDAVPDELCRLSYSRITDILGKYGCPIERKCSYNNAKSCTCQGVRGYKGSTFSYGCSWLSYQGGCKFGRTMKRVRQFKLSNYAPLDKEIEFELIIHDLADCLTPLLAKFAPEAFLNMTASSSDCRIGSVGRSRAFSGVTVVSDFCAHPHKDMNDLASGVTVILSLNKVVNAYDRQIQYHVLPHYGGLALDLGHGSILLEAARHEVHCSTPLAHPNRFSPSRLGLVFYQHRGLNAPMHGRKQLSSA